MYLNYTIRIQKEIIDNILKDDDLIKLLYYDTKDALDKPNLTDNEKDSLLFGNELIEDIEKDTSKKIYTTRFNDELINDVKSEVRIYKSFIKDNNLLMKTLFFFEILVHSKIELMENGFNRSELILDHLIECVKPISAIGKLDLTNKEIMPMTFGKSYNGFIFCASTRILID